VNPGKSITDLFFLNYTTQLFPTLLIIHHIRVISEGSYDTEDWSNDAEHSGINDILK